MPNEKKIIIDDKNKPSLGSHCADSIDAGGNCQHIDARIKAMKEEIEVTYHDMTAQITGSTSGWLMIKSQARLR
jgi:hypothetical protein